MTPKNITVDLYRLPGYDYSQSGFYFVTICCDRRECLFGEISDRQIQLNAYGAILLENLPEG